VPEFKDTIVTWNLEDIDLSELIMIIGSFIFSGHQINEVDIEVIEKMQDLIEIEYKRRLTGISEEDTIH
jgi:hypothetical protein|tara:strand:+ start:513 stop:719 length:207 start_codon:yes stop_codon:yes gene_type:complete